MILRTQRTPRHTSGEALRDATSPRFVESESSPSLACLESSPSLSFSGQDSSPSPVGFESESRCLWLNSLNPRVLKERKFLRSSKGMFHNTIINIKIHLQVEVLRLC
jgi:hypothetical protein